MTLVEMMVSFTLLAIFMTSASTIIYSAANTYYQVRSVSNGMQVSEIVQEKIAQELEGAIDSCISQEDADGNKEEARMFINADKDKVEFTNASGNHVSLGMTEENDEGEQGKQYLLLHYYDMEETSKNGTSEGELTGDETGESSSKVTSEATDWTFDEATYMGYSVKDLHFSRPTENGKYIYGEYVIQVDLTLTSPKYGTYSTTQYVECYKLKANAKTDLDSSSAFIVGGEEEE
jgi:hypothetical protein